MDIRKPPSGRTTIFAMVLSVLGALMVFVPWIAPFHRNGLVSWHGVVNLILLITLFFFLVATSPLKPVPLWRSMGLVAVAFFVLLFTGLFIGAFSPIPLEAGVYLEFAAGFLLLFVGALEIRGQLIRWQEDRAIALQPLEDDFPEPDGGLRRGATDPAMRERIQSSDLPKPM